MAKTVFVHGMRMQNYQPTALRSTWYQALIRGLRHTTWGRANPNDLPAQADVDLVFWADLFGGRGRSR